jgi:transposase InsO family protein
MPPRDDEGVNARLREIYTDPKDPAAFKGVETLYKRARELGIVASRDVVRRFLSGLNSYTLYAQSRRHYPRIPIYAHRVDQQWQADLADMQDLAKANDGHRYILTVVDTLSKFAFVEPTKTKTGKDVSAAFQAILERADPRKPERLQTDKGKEFYNSQFKALCSRYDISHFSSESDQKAAGVERFNRTIKHLSLIHISEPTRPAA